MAPERWRAGARGCHPCPGLLSHQLCHGSMGSVGVTVPLCPHPSTALQGAPEPTGHGTVAAVLRALPTRGNFHPLKPPHSHYYILLYFPLQKKVTGSSSTSATLPAKSIPLFLPFLESLWCWDSSLHDALAVAGSATHQDALREQSLPASSSRGLQDVHSPAGC